MSYVPGSGLISERVDLIQQAGASIGSSYANFAAWAAAITPVAGMRVPVGGKIFRYIGTGTAIAGAPGWALAPERLCIIPPTGGWIPSFTQSSTALGAIVIVADRISLYPWIAPADFTSLKASINVTVAAAVSSMKVMIYDADENGLPKNLVWESTALDVSAIAAPQDSTPYSFKGGVLYWIGSKCNGAPTVSGVPTGSALPIPGRGTVLVTPSTTLTRTATYATATPAVWGWNAAEISNTQGTVIWWQT